MYYFSSIRAISTTYSCTVLINAMANGHEDLVQYLAENGADVNAKVLFGEVCIKNHNPDFPPRLTITNPRPLEPRGNYDSKQCRSGSTALSYAAKMGHLRLVQVSYALTQTLLI